MDGWIDGWMDGWDGLGWDGMDRWMDWWMDRWLDKWTEIWIPISCHAKGSMKIRAQQTEPPRGKTNNVVVRPAKTQLSLGIRPVRSVFAVCMKKAWALSYQLSAQRRLWSDWADAQADLSHCWVHSHFVGFVTRQLNFVRRDHEQFPWVKKKSYCYLGILFCWVAGCYFSLVYLIPVFGLNEIMSIFIRFGLIGVETLSIFIRVKLLMILQYIRESQDLLADRHGVLPSNWFAQTKNKWTLISWRITKPPLTPPSKQQSSPKLFKTACLNLLKWLP